MLTGASRRAALLLAVAGVAMLGVVAISEVGADSKDAPDTKTLRASLGNSSGTGGVLREQHESLDALRTERPDLVDGGDSRPPMPGRVVVIGQLEHHRLIAMAPEAIRAQAARGNTDQIDIVAASPTVGVPLEVLVHQRSDDVLVLTTTHAQLVRLRDDWRTRDVLSFVPEMKMAGTLRFGPPLAVPGSDIVVPITDAHRLGLARVDVDGWRLASTKVYGDRTAMFSAACAAGNSLIVSTNGWIDRYDARTLDRLATVELPGDWAGALACRGDTVYAISNHGPYGYAFDMRTLQQVLRFEWQGSGGAWDLVVDEHEIVGADGTGVFACERRSGQCRHAKLDGKPTNVLIDGDALFVALEDKAALAVLDRRTLESRGSFVLPARPRGLVMLDLG